MNSAHASERMWTGVPCVRTSSASPSNLSVEASARGTRIAGASRVTSSTTHGIPDVRTSRVRSSTTSQARMRFARSGRSGMQEPSDQSRNLPSAAAELHQPQTIPGGQVTFRAKASVAGERWAA